VEYDDRMRIDPARLKAELDRRLISLAEFSRSSGVHMNTFVKIRKTEGRVRPWMKTVMRIVKALGMDLETAIGAGVVIWDPPSD
jgi:lambda repressor-like predicted transcriptional regulator